MTDLAHDARDSLRSAARRSFYRGRARPRAGRPSPGARRSDHRARPGRVPRRSAPSRAAPASCGHDFASNPPPSSGGVLIGYGLRLLDATGRPGKDGTAEAITALVEVMREQARTRDGRFGRDLYRGGLAKRLYSESSLRAAAERMRDNAARLRSQPHRAARRTSPSSTSEGTPPRSRSRQAPAPA